MEITEFTLERIQSLYENTVDYNLSDSSVHPYNLAELLNPQQIEEMLKLELGYGWTNGSEALRQSVARLYNNKTADNVIVTNGSAEANFLLVMSLLNPGDELVVLVPNYLQIWGWAKAIGVTVKDVLLQESLGWQPNIDDVRAALTKRTKMIAVCNPNNPTGSVLSEQTLRDLVRVAQEHELILHADEVYRGAELNGIESPSLVDLYDKAIITAGLSKSMALPGLRIGWLVGPEAEIYEAWRCKDYTSITTSAISEFIGNIVVQPDKREQILARSRAILNHNTALLKHWLDENSELFSCNLPQAGGMAFVRYTMPINSTELVHKLREECSIMLLPGDVYGLDHYIRIGIGAPSDHLTAGLKALADYARLLR